MQETIDAVYENGILRPLRPLSWLPEHSQVKVTVVDQDRLRAFREVIGTLPDADAGEIVRTIDEEFGPFPSRSDE